MTDFTLVRGFEEVWRPPARNRFRLTPTTLSAGSESPRDTRARLARIVDKAPEVVVRVTGRAHSSSALMKHLNYITRGVRLAAENPDGIAPTGRAALRELAQDWDVAAQLDSRRRSVSPLSLSLVLGMPSSTDAALVHDAARAFAKAVFKDQFDYVLVLHTDAAHPHVHMAVQRLGRRGQRLEPRKADLEVWRQVFAQALRDRGARAEATPRRARGVTRKSEHPVLRRLRLRAEHGGAEPPKTLREAYRQAAGAAFHGETALTPFEVKIVEQQRKVRALYRAQADLLLASEAPLDRALGLKVEAFVAEMPDPDSRRMALARELRDVRGRLSRREQGRDADTNKADRERSR